MTPQLTPLEQLWAAFPWIEWDEPVKVTVIGAANGDALCCRVCIALDGTTGAEVAADKGTFPSVESFKRHYAEVHGG